MSTIVHVIRETTRHPRKRNACYFIYTMISDTSRIAGMECHRFNYLDTIVPNARSNEKRSTPMAFERSNVCCYHLVHPTRPASQPVGGCSVSDVFDDSLPLYVFSVLYQSTTVRLFDMSITITDFVGGRNWNSVNKRSMHLCAPKRSGTCSFLILVLRTT